MMKASTLLIKLLMIVSLMISTNLLAEDANVATPDNAEKMNSEEECEADLLPISPQTTNGEINYISGGICISGVEQMKSIAKDFPLEVVLVEKTEEYDKENYIADVNVSINDAKGNLVFQVVTEGPFLLVDLPDGRYQVTAEYTGEIKTRKVTINKSKHTRIVLLWSKLAQGSKNDEN